MGRKRNTFSKAIKHLKSTRIDEKLQVLNEIPTMSTSGMYSLVPGALTRVEIDKENPVIPDYDTIDWDVDGGDGKDTSGLFDSNGDSKFIAPPGDNSYIQGPMAAMYYTWAYPWTTIGYIRESDRRMINLGRIDGKLGDWDGSTGNSNSGSGTFYSYGQLTTEQALWFRDTKKKDNAGNDPENANYRAFYPGPPSNSPDAFGRYYCTITGTPIGEKDNEKVVAPIDLQPSDILSAILDRLGKGERLSKREREWLKGKLPDPRSIRGNRMSKEAWAMDPEKFRQKYGMDPEDVREYYRRYPYGDPSAESQSQSQPQENKFLDLLNKGLTGLNNVLSKITDNPVTKVLDNILPSKIIADTITDRIMGGDNASSYNGQLMMQLMNSVITGNNGQIKLSNQGKQKMFDSIDPDKIADAITFGPKLNPDADNAINPGQKVEKVLTGGWGDQGGSEFSYDPETGMVTITSNKMLRAMDGDQRDSKGNIVQFEDIPNPTTDQINKIVDKAHLKKIFGVVGNIHPSRLAGYSPQEVSQAMNDRFQDVTKALYNFTVEGSASNAVWLRQQLVKAGVSPESESEKQGEGFGGHVYSQESMPLDRLPPKVQQAIRSKMNQTNHYAPEGRVLSESRKSSILKNLKKPVVLPETKQKSYKVSPGKRLNQKTDFQGMDKLIGDTKFQKSFKKPQDIWSQDWQGYNAKLSQNKKNEVLELIGDGKHAFDYMLTDSRAKNAEEMEKFWGLHPELYSYNFNGKKYKATRKEQVRGDYVVFLVDETGKKSSMLQSALNEKLSEEEEKEMLDEYNKLNPKNEPIPYEKDPLFKKVAKRLKNEINYPKKPSPKGYPDKAPPKLGPDGFHPEYGKKYKYDKLDPVSARAMPMQDNPEIDGNIEKARQQPVIEPGKEPKKLPIPKKE